MAIVYALCDPRDGSIHYIGQSLYEKERKNCWLQHYANGNSPNKFVRFWFETLKLEAIKPTFVILEICSMENAFRREEFWIEQALKFGWPLCNISKYRDPQWLARRKVRHR